MAELGTVIVASAGPNRDETNPVRLIKATMSSPEDIQTLQLIGGLDHAPLPGSKVLVLDIGESWKLAIPLADGQTPTALPGEKYLYSQLPNGSIGASVKLKLDGSAVLNDGEDSAVAFARLKAAFDAFIIEYNAHFHTLVPPVPPATLPTVSNPITVPSTANIDASQSPTVKLP
jgi:hypothetical protein